MPGKLITLANFTNPIEAELARNRLEAEGVAAFLSGDTANSMFGAALGLTIALQVRQEDVDRAEQVLAELPGRADLRREFLADAARASGGEENEDSTAIKAPEWADTGPFDENDPEARYRAADTGISPVQPRREERIQTDLEAPPPRIKDPSEPRDEDEVIGVTWKADDYAARALKSAILGPLICGGVFNLYSVYLLIRLAFLEDELSDAGMKKLYAAMAINGVVLGALVLILLSMLG